MNPCLTSAITVSPRRRASGNVAPRSLLVKVLRVRPRHDRRTQIGESLPVPRAGIDPYLMAAVDQLGNQTRHRTHVTCEGHHRGHHLHGPFSPSDRSTTRATSAREETSSLWNRLRRCVSTVLGLRKSASAISGFVLRSTTSRAISKFAGRQ